LNAKQVIILYSIVRNLAVPGVSLKKMVITIIVGAASSFGTPFGYEEGTTKNIFKEFT
jgi:hypothetical protein